MVHLYSQNDCVFMKVNCESEIKSIIENVYDIK
jgi:hypothetical protein